MLLAQEKIINVVEYKEKTLNQNMGEEDNNFKQ